MSISDDTTFQDIAKHAVFIAVMGTTGSGKSTFVHLATSSDKAVVGNNLTSCTRKPLILNVPHFGENVFLIDTPGFDDTFNSDADVLQEVASCLQLIYHHEVKLRGIIYMHRIIDPRLTHGGMRNLKMFRKLYGPEPMKNVVLLTSFWAKVTLQEGYKREEELRTTPEFWGDMIDEGAQMKRFGNTQESAFALIEILSKKETTTLQIQHEMCVEGTTLAQTSAGQQVNEELAEMAKKHAEEMQRLREEIKEARSAADKKLEQVLEKERERSEKRLEKVKAQQEALQADYRNEVRMLDQELDRQLRRIQAGQKEEVEAELKSQLAATRQEEQLNQSVMSIERKEKKKKTHKHDGVKYLKIAASVTNLALQVSVCVINPFNAGSALMSFVSLVNLVMNQPSTSTGEQEADDDLGLSANS